MKKLVLLAFLVGLTVVSKAQQDPQFTHFMFDQLSFNPASVGFKDAFCLTAISRRQWTGFSAGEPNTTLINFTAPKIDLIKGGLGFSYYNDQIGFEKNNVFRLSYSLHFRDLGLSDVAGGNFALGVSAGYIQKSINGNWITPDGIPGGSTTGADQSIPTGNQTEGGMSLNAGLYYKNPSLYLGVSTTNITQTDLKALSVTASRHYFVMGGYESPEILGGFVLKPNVMIKSDGVKTQYDFNLHVLAFNTFWAGATYRHNDAIAPMAGIQLLKGGALKVGYSYGLGTSFLSNYFANGNHEIMLNYCFSVTPPVRQEKEVHPYFL